MDHLSDKKVDKKENKKENKKEHVMSENDKSTTNILINNNSDTGKYIYMIFHMIMAFIAVYLTWKCNNGVFDLLSFLVALIFPYVYIIYILATRGVCDKI